VGGRQRKGIARLVLLAEALGATLRGR